MVFGALLMMAKAVSMATRIADRMDQGEGRMTRLEASIDQIRSDTKAIPTLTLRVENLERALAKLEKP